MRELGRLMRTYSHHRHTLWDRVLDRAESVINATEHRSTGFNPIDLHENQQPVLEIDSRLLPGGPRGDVLTRVGRASHTLKQRADERKKQADKHLTAPVYREGTRVWVRIHRKSDSFRKIARKLHLLYEGPYRIKGQVKPNAYLIVNEDGKTLGIYNSRQLRPHREPRELREDPDTDVFSDADEE